MPAERICASGLATPWPAMSGAEPALGSKRLTPSPSEAEASMPSEPVICAASSERISPNMFSVTTTSKSAGRLMSCIAVLSTSRSSSSTSGYSSSWTRWTISRHMREVSSTLRLSTLVTLFLRLRAASKAWRAMRSTSYSRYSITS